MAAPAQHQMAQMTPCATPCPKSAIRHRQRSNGRRPSPINETIQPSIDFTIRMCILFRALPFTPIYVLCPLLVSKCSHPRTPHLDEISQANPWKSRRGCHPLLSHAVEPNSSSWEIATCNTTAITRPVSLTSNWSISGSRNSKQCGQAQDLIEKQAI